MKFAQALIFLLPLIVLAFPAHNNIGQRESEQANDSQVLGGLLGTINSLLGKVASDVVGSNLRPEPGYVFQEPGPNDSRGPCPGLNLLANYGYLPRNGYVTFDQVLAATTDGFNMGPDLATILLVFAVLTDGNIATESFYLGSGPGDLGGLNRHSTVEADISPNREDYYTGCGDNHHLSSRLFTQNVNFVAGSTSQQFDIDNMGSQYAAIAQFSKTNNPYLYYFPFPSIVSLGAFAFYPNFFSNGTYEAGGVANYESISSIIGAQYNSTTNQFTYVPERWPANWYRRATPYIGTQALTQGFTEIYPRNPVGMPNGQLGTSNFNATTTLCDIYQTINSVTPYILSGQNQDAAAAITWAISKLDPYFNETVLGCPPSTLSPNYLYPNGSNEGGPLNTPPSVLASDGNNTYYRTYFATAPNTPQCSHVS